MDGISSEKRSKNMSAIKSAFTKPEMLVRQYLRSKGVWYRCNVKDLPGRPDIAIKKYRLALNVHGCFWHGHQNCKKFRLPKTNVDFWKTKIESNIERDERHRRSLSAYGYQYWEVWECELQNGDFTKLDAFVDVYRKIRSIV